MPVFYLPSRTFYLHQNDQTVYNVYEFSSSKQDKFRKMIQQIENNDFFIFNIIVCLSGSFQVDKVSGILN